MSDIDTQVSNQIVGYLKAVGLMPEGDDKTMTEAAAAGSVLTDNMLKVTESARKRILGTGATGGVLATGSGVAGVLMDNPLAIAFGVLGLAIVIAAMALGIAWITQTDTRCRAAVASETMRSRGLVTQTLCTLLLKPSAPEKKPGAATDGKVSVDAWEQLALAEMLLKPEASVVTKDGARGPLGERWWADGEFVFQVQGAAAPADCHLSDVKQVTLKA